MGSGEVEGRGENKKGRREKKREVEAEEKEGLQHKLIDMQSGCSSIRVHTLAKARTTDKRWLNSLFFAAKFESHFQNRYFYLAVGYKGLVFFVEIMID